MIHFIQTWIGGVFLGAWIVGFILSAERFKIFSTTGKEAGLVVSNWLAAIFWPIPVLFRWVKAGIAYLKTRKKND